MLIITYEICLYYFLLLKYPRAKKKVCAQIYINIQNVILSTKSLQLDSKL